MADDTYQQAQAAFDAGNVEQAYARAMQALAARPQDVPLLKLAARCSVELGKDDAASLLRRVVTVQPADADAWRDLAAAAVDAGDLPEAARALREVVRLRPDDTAALVDLAHTIYAQGQVDEAISVLAQVVGREPGNLAALRSLAEMHRKSGDLQAAARMATQITEWRHDDVLALIDLAEINLALGNIQEAVAANARLRIADTEPGHDVYAYHGMILGEMLRERWRQALDLAIDATRIDRYDLTTQVLAFIVGRVFGQSERTAPTWEEVQAALAEEAADHRRLHVEALTAW